MELIDYPATARIASFAVAGFEAAAPDVVDPHLTPASVLAPLARAWLRPTQPGGVVSAYRLEDVTVLRGGVLCDAGGRFYRGSIGGLSPGDLVARVAEADSELVALDRLGVLCKPFGDPDSLRHWLLEGLPLAWLVRQHPDFRAHDLAAAVLVVDDAAEPLRQLMIDGLQILAPPTPVATFVRNTPLRAVDLVVFDGLARPDGQPSLLAADWLRASAAKVPVGPPQLLFVSPTGSVGSGFHEPEAADLAARGEGWTVIHPTRRNFQQQVALFKGALAVVGLGGDGMAPIAFARPGTKIVHLAPATTADTTVWRLAAQAGLDYQEIRCAQTDDQPDRAAAQRDLIMTPTELRALLRRIANDVCS